MVASALSAISFDFRMLGQRGKNCRHHPHGVECANLPLFPLLPSFPSFRVLSTSLGSPGRAFEWSASVGGGSSVPPTEAGVAA